MLGCVHCLCSTEYSALTRVLSCYPTDGSSSPVSEKVHELLQWASHDVERFAPLQEVIEEKLQQDIGAHNSCNVTIGMSILSTILASLRLINLDLSRTMASLIIQIIQTYDKDLIEIAEKSTRQLIANTEQLTISIPIQRICATYIRILSNPNCPDNTVLALSDLIEHSSLEWLPIVEIFGALNEDNSSQILSALGRCSTAITLSSLMPHIWDHIKKSEKWGDEIYCNTFFFTLMTEMTDQCSLQFFRHLLSYLPPNVADVGQSSTIISTANSFVDSFPMSKIINKTSYESVSFLFDFILNHSNVNDQVRENLYHIVKRVVSYISPSDILKLASRQYWKNLDGSSPDKATELILFMMIFNESAALSVSRKIIIDFLHHILNYLTEHDPTEKVLKALLDFFKSLIIAVPSSRLNLVVPFYVSLQKQLMNEPRQNDIALHTFIMCGFKDVTAIGPPRLLQYVEKVVAKRLLSNPPMIDSTLSFVREYCPQIEQNGQRFNGTVSKLFKKKKIVEKMQVQKDRVDLMVRALSEVSEADGIEEEEMVEGASVISSIRVVSNDESESDDISLPSSFNEAVSQQIQAVNEKEDFLEGIRSLSFQCSNAIFAVVDL